MLMRGGTSKGLYLMADAVPHQAVERDRVALAAKAADARQTKSAECALTTSPVCCPASAITVNIRV